MEAVIVALIAAGPATLAALASWRTSRRTEAEMKSPNGMRSGDLIYRTYEMVVEHRSDPVHHKHKEN